jgi:hypothetical protein
MQPIRSLFIVGIVFFAPSVLLGQIYHPEAPLEVRTEEETRAWLNDRLPLPPGWTYHLENQQQTPTADYRLYGVYAGSVPAFGLQANVCIRRNGQVVSAVAPYYPRAEQLPEPLWNPEPSAPKTPVYFFDENAKTWRAAWQTRERTTEPEHRWWERFADDQTGATLYERDLLVHFESNDRTFQADTTVTGLVFDPDPLTKAGVTYGGQYVDLNDANVAVLDPLRVNKSFKASWSGTQFILSSGAVVIQDFDPPTSVPATSSTPAFAFSRTDNRFEDVNAFYHIQTFKNHTSALGFTAVPYAIPVDPHAINGQDNSFFDWSTTPPRLYFGEGGVDDAEDADVVVHEYGHAISQAIVPNTNFGDERSSLDEAFGDYWAVSYSRHLNNYGWQRVFGWDGHNEFWSGRSAQNATQKMYPGLSFFNIYAHTNVFVDALMRSWPHVGRNEMDALVLESAHQWASGMSYRTAAELVLQADTLRNNGSNAWRLHRDFATWQILMPKVSDEELTTAFSLYAWATEEGFVATTPMEVTCSDLSGRIVGTVRVEEGLHNLRALWNVPPGTYLLLWGANGAHGHFRWTGF